MSEIQIVFEGNVSGFRTDGRTGGFKLTLDVFANQLEALTKLPDFYMANVQVAIVKLPE